MQLDNLAGYIFLDGEWVNWKDAKVHVMTHSLHYGNAGFEGIRSYRDSKNPSNTIIFRLDEHSQRLINTMKLLRVNLDYSKEEINDLIKKSLCLNKNKDSYIRPLAFLDASSPGLRISDCKARLMIASYPFPNYLDSKGDISAKIVSITRHHPNINLCRAKLACNYVNSVLSAMEAQDMGCQEGILLDVHGYVSEGSGCNIFGVKDGVLYTPFATSCLEGITRDSIIKIAKDEGLEVKEANLTRDWFYLADEAFFAGTAAEVKLIGKIDNINIGNGEYVIAKKLKNIYNDIVCGKIAKYKDWLTYVNID